MKKLELSGLFLLGLSIYPLVLMAREIVAQREAYGRWDLTEVPSDEPGVAEPLRTEIGSHRVELHDALEDAGEKLEERVTTKVSIMVDGHDFGCDAEVEAQPSYRDNQNRYFGWVAMRLLIDRETSTEWVAVTQSISPPPEARQAMAHFIIFRPQLFRYRLLLIGRDGQVSEEVFQFRDRAKPPYRTMLARGATPFEIGFISQVCTVYPGILYPVFYPWLTGAAGFGLLAIGLVGRLLRYGRAVPA